MKILALVSQKGGAGKSLLSAHLAVAFHESGMKTVVIDLDRQSSSFQWGMSRRALEPAVIAARAETLSGIIDDARRERYDVAILDTPPHSDKNALGAIRMADLVLIPIRPAIFDLRAIRETIELLGMAKKLDHGVIVLNAAPAKRTVADEAHEAASSYGLPIAPVRIGERIAFAHALVGGMGVTEYEPRGKAAAEIRDLQKFITKRIKLTRKA